MPIDTPARRYVFILCFVVVLALVAKNLVRGHIGRQWMAIRDMDIAAEIMGVRPFSAKLRLRRVVVLHRDRRRPVRLLRLGAWEPAAFNIDRSFIILFMIIIGGLGSVLGSFLGAAFMALMPIFLNQLPTWLGIKLSTAAIAHIESMVFGLTIVVFLILEPRGFARSADRQGEAAALAVPALEGPGSRGMDNRGACRHACDHKRRKRDEAGTCGIGSGGTGGGHRRRRARAAQNEQFIPMLVYRTGPFSPNACRWRTGLPTTISWSTSATAASTASSCWSRSANSATRRSRRGVLRAAEEKARPAPPSSTRFRPGVTFALTRRRWSTRSR